jgi:hypothetical protein
MTTTRNELDALRLAELIAAYLAQHWPLHAAQELAQIHMTRELAELTAVAR